MTDAANSNEMNAQSLYLLGEIHGIVQGLRKGQEVLAERMTDSECKQEERLQRVEDLHRAELARVESRVDGHDDRLRDVEKRAAVLGALSGSAVSVGIALMVEGLREALKR